MLLTLNSMYANSPIGGAMPFPGGERGYSNWELSADRANASRRELVAGGLPDDRTLRVQGLASSSPFDSQDPRAPANRRISIIVMNREAEDRVFRTRLEPAAAPAEPAAGTSLAPVLGKIGDSSPQAHGR